MSEITTTTTTTCRICLEQIKQESEFELNLLRSKLKSEQDSSITNNPVACNKCKIEIDGDHQLRTSYVKEEKIEHEHVDEGIKAEDFFDDDCELFNTDVTSKLEFEQGLSITDDPVACNTSFVKQEIVEEGINTEDLVDDIPLCIEKSVFYYCDKCDYIANNKKILTDHVLIHCFKCNQCGFATFDNYSLIYHKRIHFEKIGSLQCNICVASNSFDEHTSSHNGEKKRLLECHDCGYRSLSKITLKIHMKAHQKLVQRPCSFVADSNYSLKSKLSVDKISTKHSFGCDKCAYKTTAKFLLLRHNTIHLNDKQFKCSSCDYSCNFSHYLDAHVMKHSGEKPFGCDKCAYKTSRKGNLAKHKITHFEEKPFKCNVCDYRCNFSHNLKTHLMKHSGEQPFNCDKCGYKTNQKANLQKHKRIHYEEKPFKCSLCGCGYKSSYNLKEHSMKHSGEQPFGCDKCAYKTGRKSNLQQHKRIHSEEKLFKCSMCDYSCYFSNSFKLHSRKHAGEQRFSCDKCDFKTSKKWDLRRHKTVHFEEKLM